MSGRYLLWKKNAAGDEWEEAAAFGTLKELQDAVFNSHVPVKVSLEPWPRAYQDRTAQSMFARAWDFARRGR